MTTPFQPQSPTPVDPLDALADLEADFQGVTNPPEVVVIQAEPPPIGRSYAFDFLAQRFRTADIGNAPLPTNDIVTLIYWMEKCLRTARGAHPVHPPGYGIVNPMSLLGLAISGAPVPDMEPRIRDALTFHPRIVDIEDFEWDADPNDEWVAISFTVVLDDDTRLPLDSRLTLSDITTTGVSTTSPVVTGGLSA